MSANKRLTIGDVAAAAGVSKTTVSRYINGRTDLMSEKTRERIRTVIELTGFVPSDIASNLKKRKTNIIGLLVADIKSPFSSALSVGCGIYMEEHGYTLINIDTSESLKKEQNAIKSLLSKGVAGLLVNTVSYNNDFLIQTKCQNVPIVLCDRHVRNHIFDIVSLDNRDCIMRLVLHLKEQGYTRPLLFLQDWENNSSRIQRREAFLDLVKEIYGYDASEDVYVLQKEGPGARDCLKEALKKYKGELPAVIGANSVTTVRLFRAAKELGLDIPKQLGICGTEDWDWSTELNWPLLVVPNITTVKIPATQIGMRAAELMIERLENPDGDPKEIYLPCEFIPRESTCLK